MTINRRIALTYAQFEVRIFPCREMDSGSGMAKAPYVEGGWHSASSNRAQIGSWWKTWPNALIGLPCRLNGIIAIDADRHGLGDGVAALSELFAQHGFDPNSVPCVLTPRDGRHCLFRRSPRMGDTKARIAPAIDVRDKAYVVAAGSIMADGRRYSLFNGSPEHLSKALRDGILSEPPLWLASMIEKPAVTSMTRAYEISTDNRSTEKRLAGLVRTVVLASSGQRNATLHWASCRAGELVEGGFIRPEIAVAIFTQAGRQAGLSESEARATAQSGIRTGHAGVCHER